MYTTGNGEVLCIVVLTAVERETGPNTEAKRGVVSTVAWLRFCDSEMRLGHYMLEKGNNLYEGIEFGV